MTDRELALLIVGVGFGFLVAFVRARVQRALVLRAEQAVKEDEIAKERAQQLRQKLEEATYETEWRLDENAAFDALFSDNGFEVVSKASRRISDREAATDETEETGGEETPLTQPGQDEVKSSSVRKASGKDRPVTPTTDSAAQA